MYGENLKKFNLPSNLSSNRDDTKSIRLLSSLSRDYPSSSRVNQQLDDALKDYKAIQQQLKNIKNLPKERTKNTFKYQNNSKNILGNNPYMRPYNLNENISNSFNYKPGDSLLNLSKRNNPEISKLPEMPNSNSEVIQKFQSAYNEADDNIKLIQDQKNNSFYQNTKIPQGFGFNQINGTDISNINPINTKSPNDYYNDNILTQGNEQNETEDLLPDKDSILQVENSILRKNNLDLRNYNKILNMELLSIKSNLNQNKVPFTQYDQNISKLIDILKNALNSSQMTNIELEQIKENISQKSDQLMQQMYSTNQQFEQMDSELNQFKENNDGLSEMANQGQLNYDELLAQFQNLDEALQQLKNEIYLQQQTNEELKNQIEDFNKDEEEENEKMMELQSKLESENKEEEPEKINEDEEEITQNIKKEDITQNNDIMTLERQIQEISERIENENNELNTLLQQENEISEILENKENEVDQLQKEKACVESEIKKLQENSETLKKLIENKNKVFETNISGYDVYLRAKEQRNLLDTKLGDQEDSLTLKRNELVKLYIQIDQKEKNLEEIREKYSKILEEKNRQLREFNK